MRVFLSWSGEKSRRLAEALRDWLPNVHQQIEIFFSPNDIEKGAKWANEIEVQLRDTQYCIVCLTPEALQSAWINFESGAISKGIGQSRITPILFDITKSDVSGPLSLFQLADFEESEMLHVLKSVNASSENRLSDEILKRALERWWPDLKARIESILKESPSKKPPSKSQKEISDEILLNTREIMKLVGQGPTNRNKAAIGLLFSINTSLTRIHRDVIAENYAPLQKRLYLLGKRVVELNAAVGKTGGSSLIDLKAWAKMKPHIEENEEVDDETAVNSTKSASIISHTAALNDQE
jgi:hypothetical protein